VALIKAAMDALDVAWFEALAVMEFQHWAMV
jgi:hypothetical protein